MASDTVSGSPLYMAKPDTWFDEGVVISLIADYRGEGVNMGLFYGRRNGSYDQEVCSFDEFVDFDECLTRTT